MPQLVAFLRAVNVGGRTVKMDVLRRAFEAMGMANVQTVIASGNVVFETRSRAGATLEAKVEAALEKTLGYEVATFIRTMPELEAVLKRDPFRPTGGGTGKAGASGRTYVAFLKSAPPPALVRKIRSFETAIDAFHVQGRELYWRCLAKTMDSDFSGAVLEKTLSAPATLRNTNTIERIVTKYTVHRPRGREPNARR
jgi:uncharacterized protein (DUF1697 family)